MPKWVFTTGVFDILYANNGIIYSANMWLVYKSCVPAPRIFTQIHIKINCSHSW